MLPPGKNLKIKNFKNKGSHLGKVFLTSLSQDLPFFKKTELKERGHRLST